jgi:hypothetical protein
MKDPIPEATIIYNEKREPIDILINGHPFPAPIVASDPITVEFNAHNDFQTVTASFFVRNLSTHVADEK